MPSLVEKIVNWPTPKTVKQVRSFVQTANYYRKFIPQFAETAAPLQRMFKKHAKFQWGDEQELAFQILKKRLSEQPLLKVFDDSGTIVLDTDASKVGIGGVLQQFDKDGNLRPIAYYSRSVRGHELNYTVSELEC